ncbi:hypothetical protein N1031_18505 [Herbiconiux moechotypicola]|uniref:Transmembrane protein n=1 Tax=Herbiconiux moechotypicola TaxID=637393 RepID=A0ABN3DQ34_9MICO|nr:hypothetical protein [Herbiconiux moechotypicola]MCS5731751.1 hypothetical protein [Herbiconiux moechotypicola]
MTIQADPASRTPTTTTTIVFVVLTAVAAVVSSAWGAFCWLLLPLYCARGECGALIVGPVVLLILVPLAVAVVSIVLAARRLTRGQRSAPWAVSGFALVLVSAIIGTLLSFTVR